MGDNMSWKRRTLLKMHGKYHMVNDHFVKEHFKRFGTYESQGSVTYRCVDCGEEHKHALTEFSQECPNKPTFDGYDVNIGDVFIAVGLLMVAIVVAPGIASAVYDMMISYITAWQDHVKPMVLVHGILLVFLGMAISTEIEEYA